MVVVAPQLVPQVQGTVVKVEMVEVVLEAHPNGHATILVARPVEDDQEVQVVAELGHFLAELMGLVPESVVVVRPHPS